jgi:glutamine amidotransferase
LCFTLRRHPFAHATLQDEDVSISYEHTSTTDRVAVVRPHR